MKTSTLRTVFFRGCRLRAGSARNWDRRARRAQRTPGLTLADRADPLAFTISVRYTSSVNSKTDMAILGMLTVEPMSGYDMKRFCERSFAHFWHESFGNIYPRLRRLEAEGLVSVRRVTRPQAPDAMIHSLTTKGRARFRQWMEEPPEQDRVRSEFLLKIFFGAQAPSEFSARWIREHEREQLRVRSSHVETGRAIQSAFEGRPESVYWQMALRRGQLLTDARLAWCRESLATLQQEKRTTAPGLY